VASGEGSMSLNEKLENAISRLGFWYRITIIMVVIGLVSLSAIISASQIYFHEEIGKHGYIEEIFIEATNESVLAFIPYSEEIFSPEGIVTLFLTQIWLMIGNGIAIGLLGFLVFWVTYRGHKHTTELESIERQFIRQSYLVNFETSIPEGDTKVDKILNQAALVFPALKYIQQKKPASKIKLNKQVNGYTIDAIVPTKKGDFIVKFFDNVVTYDEIESLCEKLSKSRARIYRVLFIAKDFQQELQTPKLVDLMDDLSTYFKVDLIFEEEQGYSMLWID